MLEFQKDALVFLYRNGGHNLFLVDLFGMIWIDFAYIMDKKRVYAVYILISGGFFVRSSL